MRGGMWESGCSGGHGAGPGWLRRVRDGSLLDNAPRALQPPLLQRAQKTSVHRIVFSVYKWHGLSDFDLGDWDCGPAANATMELPTSRETFQEQVGKVGIKSGAGRSSLLTFASSASFCLASANAHILLVCAHAMPRRAI